MERAGKNTCGFTSKSVLQNFSRENIDQIRNIIMLHEELFKEQVQALHKLYNVQKLAMEELQKLLYFHNGANDNQNCNPILEGKSSKVAKFNAQESEADPPVIHTQYPCACNEFTGIKTKNYFFLKTVERKNLSNSQDKMRKRIDLERPPEEDINESDYQTVANDLEADSLQDFQQENLPSVGPDSVTMQSKTPIDSLPEKLSQSSQLKTSKQVADGTSILDTLSQDASKCISILGISVQLPLHCKFLKESPDNLFSHHLVSPGNNLLSDKYGTVHELVEGSQVQGTPPEGELNQEESFRNENENLEKQSISEEACESIAAKILLSFAPSRLPGDDKWQCFQTQIGRTSSRSIEDSSTHGKRINRSARIGVVNHKNNVVKK